MLFRNSSTQASRSVRPWPATRARALRQASCSALTLYLFPIHFQVDASGAGLQSRKPQGLTLKMRTLTHWHCVPAETTLPWFAPISKSRAALTASHTSNKGSRSRCFLFCTKVSNSDCLAIIVSFLSLQCRLSRAFCSQWRVCNI